MGWILANWLTILTIVLAVIGGASIIVRAIAPVTNTKVDDKAAGILKKIHDALSKLALNPKSDE